MGNIGTERVPWNYTNKQVHDQHLVQTASFQVKHPVENSRVDVEAPAVPDRRPRGMPSLSGIVYQSRLPILVSSTCSSSRNYCSTDQLPLRTSESSSQISLPFSQVLDHMGAALGTRLSLQSIVFECQS